jgi:hypothetical protein
MLQYEQLVLPRMADPFTYMCELCIRNELFTKGTYLVETDLFMQTMEISIRVTRS